MCGFPVETIEAARRAAKTLLEFGAKISLITLGEDGAIVMSTETDCEHVEIEKNVSVVDSTGAGDSFVGTLALLFARMPNLSLKEKVSRACRVASQSVEKNGTQTSYPQKDELRFNLFA